MSNQFTILKWGCLYPGCPMLLDDVKVALNKKYCKFHVLVRKKEHWTNSNKARAQGVRKPKLGPLIYLLKTNKIVSMYQVLSFCKIKHRRTIYIHMVALRKQGHIIKFKKGFYFYEGKK